jgi:hypothetical protein
MGYGNFGNRRFYPGKGRGRGMTWQPIETAPKDGTEVLLYHPDLGMACWPWWGRQGPWHEVTHWMPLPPPPDVTPKTGDEG